MSILNQLLMEKEEQASWGPAPVNANYNSGEAEAAVNDNNNVDLFGLPSPCQ